MMKPRIALTATLFAACSLAFSVQAAPPGHQRGDVVADVVYAGITAVLAREYARDLGLRGYSSLPPGIRKNLARGKPLPPGIAKKMVPGSLLSRLPRHPGYEWRIAGTDLILVSIATAVIADILYDVFD